MHPDGYEHDHVSNALEETVSVGKKNHAHGVLSADDKLTFSHVWLSVHMISAWTFRF